MELHGYNLNGISQHRESFQQLRHKSGGNIRVTEEVLAFITEAGARSVVMTDRIIGCPHEEGIDYEGETCPACPFWAGRDRWAGSTNTDVTKAERLALALKAKRGEVVLPGAGQSHSRNRL
jgi:hypothetical protein